MNKIIIFLCGCMCMSSPLFAATPQFSHAQNLARDGIIVTKSSYDGYRFDDSLLRQEAIGIAIRLAGVNLPDVYTCQNYFYDVGRSAPNTWACRAVEMAADQGLITRSNAHFRPEDTITRAEAAAIMFSAVGITAIEQNGDIYDADVVSWQKKIVSELANRDLLRGTIGAGMNIPATRGFIFMVADEVRSSQKGYTSYQSQLAKKRLSGTSKSMSNTTNISPKRVSIYQKYLGKSGSSKLVRPSE